jgi:hypothetical protein
MTDENVWYPLNGSLRGEKSSSSNERRATIQRMTSSRKAARMSRAPLKDAIQTVFGEVRLRRE